jgi:hypothetical protein
MTGAEIRMARVIIDGMRVQVQHGNPLSIEQQRALLGHMDRLQKQDDANVNRLVAAREKFDLAVKMEHDGSRLSKPLLSALMELGSALAADDT